MTVASTSYRPNDHPIIYHMNRKEQEMPLSASVTSFDDLRSLLQVNVPGLL